MLKDLFLVTSLTNWLLSNMKYKLLLLLYILYLCDHYINISFDWSPSEFDHSHACSSVRINCQALKLHRCFRQILKYSTKNLYLKLLIVADVAYMHNKVDVWCQCRLLPVLHYMQCVFLIFLRCYLICVILYHADSTVTVKVLFNSCNELNWFLQIYILKNVLSEKSFSSDIKKYALYIYIDLFIRLLFKVLLQ